MPQLMPLYWCFSFLTGVFIFLIMLEMYLLYNVQIIENNNNWNSFDLNMNFKW